MQEFKDDVGMIMDYISENITGYSYDENISMRILINYKIEEIPKDIIINDVTDNFNRRNKL